MVEKLASPDTLELLHDLSVDFLAEANDSYDAYEQHLYDVDPTIARMAYTRYEAWTEARRLLISASAKISP